MLNELSLEEARALLVSYHLTETDAGGVLARLGSIQYDPLNPLGRNPDLMLQARIPGYQVDDWQVTAYQQRLMYDAWDKQQCLVPVSDWPQRALTRTRYQPWHDRSVLVDHTDVVTAALAQIDSLGPLCSLDFVDRRQISGGHSWYGSSLIKRVLRALWARGDLVTHHRESGRHYFDRAERVIPEEHMQAVPLTDDRTYHRWIVRRRHQAAGLLRPAAAVEVWCACGTSTDRAQAIGELIESGEIERVLVGPRRTVFHITAGALALLERPAPNEGKMTFIAPLDNLIWDRKAIEFLFNFRYAWEVYKPPANREWGYYVLPILYGDRFVGRFDSRVVNGVWRVAGWWWEDGVEMDEGLLSALQDAVTAFLRYLRVEGIEVDEGVDAFTRGVLAGVA